MNLLLIHWPNPQIPLAETMGAMCKMKREGYARHIGISNFTVKLIDEAVKLSSEPIVTNQIEWHPYLDEEKVRAACAKHGIAVTAYCPIARGRAVGDEVMTRIGKTHGKTAGQVSLRWLIQKGAIVIPRTSKVERLTENMSIFDFELTRAGDGRDRRAGKARRPRGQRRLGAELGLDYSAHDLIRKPVPLFGPCAIAADRARALRALDCAAPRHARSTARPR